jgi:hypothetical protein
MIERLISIATTVTSVIKDYRQCKSIIDAILQLMSLVTKTGSIPSSLLPLSSFLPGYSPNRAFIGTIEEMQKLGLPTGPLPDGSPNLQVQSVFAAMKSQDEEQKINGKLEAVAILPPPFLKSKVHGKSR